MIQIGPNSVGRHIDGYIEGFPDKASLYPVEVELVKNDNGVFLMTGIAKHDGKEYRNSCLIKPDEMNLVLLHEGLILKGIRKTLSKLGIVVWPPPITDKKAWGLGEQE